MSDINSLAYTKWNSKYHIVFAGQPTGALDFRSATRFLEHN